MKLKLNQFIQNHPYFFGALTLTFFTLLIYGNVVFGPSDIIISHPGSDISLGLGNVQFTFTELAKGNFPLWNPHMLSGYPWFASFQTLLLYPPAWIFLVFPTGTAINIFIAFHVFLIGFSAFCWLKQQGLHPLSCVIGGTLLMFCSQVTMQIYSGAVTPIATMPWMLFLLLAVDGCFQSTHRLRWILAGIAFVTMQIMAGFPQHVYYTGLIVGLYCIGKMCITSSSWRERLKVLLALTTIYVWGVLICAIQLFTTFDAATETARQGKLPFAFAGSYSFPPWNLFTLIAPFIFGDDKHLHYWGRSNIWEMLFFIGVTGLFLAICGIFYGKKKERLIYLGLITVTLLTALGFYTIFYNFLYNYVPGFGSFRANFRILFQCSVFIAALAAMGFDALLKAAPTDNMLRKLSGWTVAITAFCGCLSAAVYWQSLPGHLSWFQAVMTGTLHSGIQRMEPRFYTDIPNILSVAQYTFFQLTLTTITFIIIALCLFQLKRNSRGIYYLGVLAVIEILFFTAIMRPTFSLSETEHPVYNNFLQQHPGDARFVQFQLNNWANGLPDSLSGGDLSGYESFRLRRYDSFAQFAMGKDPYNVEPSLHFEKVNPLFGLLRCKYVFDEDQIRPTTFDTLPHLLLVPQWKVLEDSEKVLLHLKHPEFKPKVTALLEREPRFAPPSKIIPAINAVTLLGSSSDWLDIKATVRERSILLVTDTYAKGWKVFPYPDSSQQQYEVMPADYVIRGIPLSPGTHHFRLQYAPDAFYRGRNISCFALLLYLLGWGALLLKSRKTNR